MNASTGRWCERESLFFRVNPSIPGQGVTFTANVFSASSATRRQGP